MGGLRVRPEPGKLAAAALAAMRSVPFSCSCFAPVASWVAVRMVGTNAADVAETFLGAGAGVERIRLQL